MLIQAHGRSYELAVDPESHIGRRIAETGEPFESPLLEHIYGLGLSGVALDVGANIGNHTLWFDIVCGLSVVAFEPVTVTELEANVAANGLDVRIEPVALGAQRGRAADRGVRAGVEGAESTDYETWGFNHKLALGRGEIPVRTLDSFGLCSVVLIKVDVEGMEAAVLAGGEQTIRSDRPVIFAEAVEPGVAEVLEPWGYHCGRRFRRGTPLEEWRCSR